jgi:hypothetical protein
MTLAIVVRKSARYGPRYQAMYRTVGGKQVCRQRLMSLIAALATG